MVRTRVFMDFAVADEPYGRVIFELFNDTAPKTCENFRSLCTGERGLSTNGNALHYKGSIIHRSIKDFMIQGGDFSHRNGTGGESIYGGTFSDEDLQRYLDSPALLCMANKGPNTNGSQFFITLRSCPHLNGRHVVFGKVIRGFEDVVQRLAEVPVDQKDKPTKPVHIINCGELELRKRRDAEHPPRTRKSKKHRSRRENSSESRYEKQEKPERDDKIKTVDSRLQHSEQKETEEEYDARLQREEAERLEQERIRTLIRIRGTRQDSTQGVVRFKGKLI